MRFYAVVPMEPGQPSLEACLKKIMGIGQNVAREVEGTAVQAMKLAQKGSRISGDLIRLQSDNLPSLIESLGKKPTKLPLSGKAALGHHTAFLYDTSLRKLAYQLTRNAVPYPRHAD